MLDVSVAFAASKPHVAVAPALILRASDLSILMDAAAYLAAVEAAFRSYATGTAIVPMPMHIALDNGGFHAKGACVPLERPYVAVKVNGNFSGNPVQNGLPTIQGALLLFDGDDGRLLAVIDSAEITLRRTAAATALAARYLAREDADSVAVCGCGAQGRAQLAALAEVVSLKHISAWDIDIGKARAFAHEMGEALAVDAIAAAEVRAATLGSDIIVTATTARQPFLTHDCVSAGTFVAAVGADHPHKNELDGQLLGRSKIVVDSLSQCIAMGDVHHAIDAGVVSSADVHAQLGDVVVGRACGRTDAHEVTVFDSTGLAIEDVASAACAYRRATAAGVGMSVVLAS